MTSRRPITAYPAAKPPRSAIALACFLAAAFPLTALATNDTWSTATSGNFSTGPWTPGVPGSADTALFTQTGTYTVTFTTSPTNTAFQVTTGSVTFNASGSAQIYSLSGASIVNGNGSLTLGTATGTVFTLSASDLSVNGTAASVTAVGNANVVLNNLNIGSIVNGVGTFTNAGASVSLRTTSTLNVGTGANATGILNLTGGTLTTGSGQTTIGTDGKVTLNGGALSVDGDLLVSAGTLTQSTNTFALNLADSHTMTINNGGVVSVAGIWAPGTSDLIAITGTKSAFNDTGTSAELLLEHGSTVTIGLGGALHSDGAIELGVFGNGVITVEGVGSSLTATSSTVVGEAATGALTFSNSATGSLTAGFQIGQTNGGNGTLSILTSASVTSGQLAIASQGTTAVGVVNITGGTLTQSGAVATTIGSASGGSATLTIGAGGVYSTGTGATSLNATGIINLAGTLNQNGNLTVTAGTLTQNGGTFSLAASRNVTIQSGGKVNLTGAFTTSTSDSIAVTGSGSQLSQIGANADLVISNGSSLTVTSGGFVHSDKFFDIGTNGSGSASFDGSGTSFTSNGTAAIAQSFIGIGGAGTLTFSSSATGTALNGFIVGSGNASSGILKVQSSASLSTGSIDLADQGFAATALVNVTGGSLTQAGASFVTVGQSSLAGGSATLTVGAGGVYTTGTGITTINTTGIVQVAGTLSINGDLTVAGGTLTQSVGTLSLPTSHGLAINSGGLVSLPGSFTTPTGSVTAISDPGTLFHLNGATTAIFSVENGSTLSVKNGATLHTDFVFNIANSSSGTSAVTVDGLGSTLTADSTTFANTIGTSGTGSLTLSTSASAFLPGGLVIGESANSGGSLSIQSSAILTTGSIGLAEFGNLATALVNITGGTLTQSGAATSVIGSPAGAANLTVGTGGVYNTGTGVTQINASGKVSVSGGTLNENGDLTITAGSLTLSSGTFNWANSHTMTIQSGGVASFAGTFLTPTGAVITVTGAGSQLNATGASATIRDVNGVAISVTAGGAIHSDLQLNMGNGSITVDGTGSSFSSASSVAENIIGNGTGVSSSLTLQNSATGSATNGFSIATINASGFLSVLSSASLTSGNIDLANDVSSSTGLINVTGGTLTQSGNAHLTIGRGSNGNATLTLGASGVFNTGTGLTTINPTGIVKITGGAFNPNGDLLVSGGTLTQSTGSFSWAANHTMTIQSAGAVSLTGFYSTPNSATINITGAGSTLADTGTGSAFLVIANNTFVSVQSGGLLHSDLYFNIGATSGSGAVTVDGANSSITSATSLSAGENQLGTSGFGSLAFSNSATGYLFNGLQLGNAAGSGGSLSVQSGASLNVGPLDVGSSPSVSLASVNITGGTVTQVGNSTLTIGSSSLSNASVIVGAAGVLTTGSGAVTLNPTANVSIQSGGTLSLKGNMSIAAGANFTGTGSLNASANITNAGNFTQSGAQFWASGSTFTNTAGTASFLSDPGLFTPNTLTLIVSGGTARLISFDKLAALTINGGKAVFGPSALTPAASSTTTVTVGAAGTLEFAASYSFASPLAPTLTGSGQITIDPGVTLTLRVDSAFSGTILDNGILFLTPALNPNATTFNFSVITASPDTAPPSPEPASLALLALSTPLLLSRRKAR